MLHACSPSALYSSMHASADLACRLGARRAPEDIGRAADAAPVDCAKLASCILEVLWRDWCVGMSTSTAARCLLPAGCPIAALLRMRAIAVSMAVEQMAYLLLSRGVCSSLGGGVSCLGCHATMR